MCNVINTQAMCVWYNKHTQAMCNGIINTHRLHVCVMVYSIIHTQAICNVINTQAMCVWYNKHTQAMCNGVQYNTHTRLCVI